MKIRMSTTNVVTITKPGGQVVLTSPISPPGAAGSENVPAAGHRLLPSIAPKAARIEASQIRDLSSHSRNHRALGMKVMRRAHGSTLSPASSRGSSGRQ